MLFRSRYKCREHIQREHAVKDLIRRVSFSFCALALMCLCVCVCAHSICLRRGCFGFYGFFFSNILVEKEIELTDEGASIAGKPVGIFEIT